MSRIRARKPRVIRQLSLPRRMRDALLMTSPHHSITTDPLRCGGRPCTRNLRISVGEVPGWLAMGQTAEELVADYSEQTLADIRSCLA